MNTNGPGTLAAESPHQARLRACATCSRAKAKCVSGGDIAGKCQRCSRLNKPCEAPPSRARAAPKKRAPLQTSRVSKNQVAVLEEKLDGLVYLLKATKESGTSAMVTPPQSRHAPTTSTPSQGAEEVPTDPEAEVWDERLHNGGSIQQRFALPPVDPLPMQPFLTMAKEYPLPDFDLGSEDPDVLLNIFRHEMKASFPFITTPDHVSAQELRRTRPAFFTTIMAVTTRVTSQQKVISAVVMKQLAERIVTDGERNLDLLLATLTYSAWCYYYFLNHTQFTVLLSLTTTLVADMRLNRPAPKYGSEARIAALQISRGYPPLPSLEKTPETHRALLGYWYLNSIISGFFHKLETIPWTDHLESSCQTLAASLDADDKSAATLIRLQLVSERINQSPWHGKVFSSSPGPPALYIHFLKQQLHDLKTTLNAELEGNFCIPLAYWHAEISLYKIGLSKSPLLCDFLGHDFDRLECLHSCLQAVKSFFDTWLSIPTSMCHCLSVPMITHFTWSLGVLQLLATFNHPDWNLEWAREKISFTDILDKHAKKFAEAKTVLGLDPHTAIGEDIFSHSARRMAWMKSYFETDGAHARLNPLPPCLMPVDAPEFPQGIDMDFMDDEWMRDMLELW